MNRFSRISVAVGVAGFLAVAAVAARAGNTTFFSSIGDLVFPFTAPTNNPAAPGTIDNMTIGATTPAAGHFTTVTSSSGSLPAAITGAATPFPITGQAPATATSAGGAVAVAGGVGGATSGNGGAVSSTGGAATAGNGVGGAASLVGGAGQGSGNGGAASVTGGAAGATGIGGAVAIAAGAPTAGNGSNVTVTASAGAGGTNAGGSVNLVPGAAVSTGLPGKVQFNGNASVICQTYFFTGTIAANNQVFFLATRPMIVDTVSEVHSVAAGGTSTLQVTHDTGTGVPASGTDVLGTDFNLNATANTPQAGTLSATVATLTLAAGDRLAVKYVNTIQSSAGVVVTACMAPQ